MIIIGLQNYYFVEGLITNNERLVFLFGKHAAKKLLEMFLNLCGFRGFCIRPRNYGRCKINGNTTLFEKVKELLSSNKVPDLILKRNFQKRSIRVLENFTIYLRKKNIY